MPDPAFGQLCQVDAVVGAEEELDRVARGAVLVADVLAFELLPRHRRRLSALRRFSTLVAVAGCRFRAASRRRERASTFQAVFLVFSFTYERE